MLAVILHARFLDEKTLTKVFLSFLCSLYCAFKLNLATGSMECPDCYGDEFCEAFQKEEIYLTWFSRFLTVINPSLTKGVFHGVWNGSQIVIKRKSGLSERGSLKSEAGLSGLRFDPEKVQNAVLCPSVRNLGFLIDKIQDRANNRKLWWNVGSSIEPLLLMFFQSTGSWPVPKYLGACGDLIVEEYKGQPLTNFLFSKFDFRALLAIHLLDMAHLFTFGHPMYSFYFTDYSLDNVVADSEERVFLIDLDNVIISNKTATKAEKKLHTSLVLDEVKYAFSPSDICAHEISDHNFFSVCKYLLSHSENGLLREIPREFEVNFQILHFLKECAEPKVMRDRFSAALNLRSLLEEIMSTRRQNKKSNKEENQLRVNIVK